MNYAEEHHATLHKIALNGAVTRMVRFSAGLVGMVMLAVIFAIFKQWVPAGFLFFAGLALLSAVCYSINRWREVRDAVISFSCVEAARKNPPGQ